MLESIIIYSFNVARKFNVSPDINICDMPKARSLANVYYWNTWYRKQDNPKRFKMYCPKEWALQIISEEEYNNLIKISEED